jgi:hypothetical protein
LIKTNAAEIKNASARLAFLAELTGCLRQPVVMVSVSLEIHGDFEAQTNVVKFRFDPHS